MICAIPVALRHASLLLLLVACSSSYQYTRPELKLSEQPPRILLAVDYLAMRDRPDRRWEFDEDQHRQALEKADAGLVELIQAHGFVLAEQTLLSSGLWLDARLEVDHFLGGERQSAPIHPPFLLGNQGLSEVAVEALADLYPQLARQLAGIEVEQHRLREFNLFNYRGPVAEIDPQGAHLLLVVQFHDPSVSLMKQLGLLLVGAGISQVSDVGYASFDLRHQNGPRSFAYLIDTSSGQLLWKNSTSRIDLSGEELKRLFTGFPVRP